MRALIGRPVMFVPSFFFKKEFHDTKDDMVRPVRGKIVEVNRHGWFRVRYSAGDTVQHECFKQCDIGTAVTLLGHKKDR